MVQPADVTTYKCSDMESQNFDVLAYAFVLKKRDGWGYNFDFIRVITLLS